MAAAFAKVERPIYARFHSSSGPRLERSPHAAEIGRRRCRTVMLAENVADRRPASATPRTARNIEHAALRLDRSSTEPAAATGTALGTARARCRHRGYQARIRNLRCRVRALARCAADAAAGGTHRAGQQVQQGGPMADRMKMFIRAHVPTEQANEFLQHVRDFDSAHPDCHFEIGADVPDLSLAQVLEMLALEPGLTFAKVHKRKA
jgi:hypothetical protein